METSAQPHPHPFSFSMQPKKALKAYKESLLLPSLLNAMQQISKE